jgi:hypothetical protein
MCGFVVYFSFLSKACCIVGGTSIYPIMWVSFVRMLLLLWAPVVQCWSIVWVVVCTFVRSATESRGRQGGMRGRNDFCNAEQS